jgi:hypothetical protein
LRDRYSSLTRQTLPVAGHPPGTSAGGGAGIASEITATAITW